MEEISTSFCFICLLHLANEQGLKLESVPEANHASFFEHPSLEDEGDVSAVDKRVGNLWDLKVRTYL
jgi:condensin complex subunit 2